MTSGCQREEDLKCQNELGYGVQGGFPKRIFKKRGGPSFRRNARKFYAGLENEEGEEV